MVGIALTAAFRDRIDPAELKAWIAGLGITVPLVFTTVYALASVLFRPGMAAVGRSEHQKYPRSATTSSFGDNPLQSGFPAAKRTDRLD